MYKMSRPFFCELLLFLICLCSPPASVAGGTWQTLHGNAPLVIARGGFSGIFPGSSLKAYEFAVENGLDNLFVWCDVQRTKDGAGICFPDFRLERGSNVVLVYGPNRSTYPVNGFPMTAWFPLDFTLDELSKVNLKQGIYRRPKRFDHIRNPIQSVDDVVKQAKPAGLWLNIPYAEFYSQHNLSMRSFVISISRRMRVGYISSPEVGFLTSTISEFRNGPTKLIFQLLDPNKPELSTDLPFSSLAKNLTFIKSFASGILVPKSYIWPVDNNLYLQNYTSLVLDAHKAGLEVFASDFSNDISFAYNYNYDPVAEYLSFIDKDNFSVDGVLSDFPITASATIDCYSHMGKNETEQVKLMVISSEGASGYYPGCTDKAYAKAVSDGVDILDCPVQITSDGVLFCFGSINLRNKTNVAESVFNKFAATNPDLNIQDGIFAYDLTWSQIQSLQPVISNPYSNNSLFRNPRARNDGNFMHLTDFLAFAYNASSVSGVLIGIENAAYLAEKQGLDVINAVLIALVNGLLKSGNNITSKKMMIKSSNSAVLEKLKTSGGNYELVYVVDEDVQEIFDEAIVEIKKFADSVVISKRSVFPTDFAYTTGQTSIVPRLHASYLRVYVQFFQNEFVSQPWDFFSDAYMEILTYVDGVGIDGVITDYPATAAKFKRNRCLGYKNRPVYMRYAPPGGLISIIPGADLPPAQRVNGVVTYYDVEEPPLPPVIERPTGNGSKVPPPAPAPRNGQTTLVASTTILTTIAVSNAFYLFCWRIVSWD